MVQLSKKNGIKLNQEPIGVMNLGTKEERKEVEVTTKKGKKEKDKIIKPLRKFLVVFTWSYINMPRLDTSIVVYKIPLFSIL